MKADSAAEALWAAARIVDAADTVDLPALQRTLAHEAGRLIGAERAAVLSLEDEGRTAIDAAGDRHEIPTATGPLGIDATQALLAALADEDERAELGRSILALALPPEAPSHLLIFTHRDQDAFDAQAHATAAAVVALASLALAQRHDAHEDERAAARSAALTRAAQSLHDSLDLATVLSRICAEATRILDADYTAVYRVANGMLILDAVYGLPPELIGFELASGAGVAGKVYASEQPMLTNDYQAMSGLDPDGPFGKVRSCVATPLRWSNEVRGVITVGYMRDGAVTDDELGMLEAFGELATVACSNATAHAGLALAARTDGLTGCLNHAAMHESLHNELERAERSVTPALAIVMIDLDDFKSINETHGHLVGDEVLRRAGHALRQAIRPYDVAARYGGDEFAIVAVEATERDAEEIAARAIARISAAISDLCEGGARHATAGIAEWTRGMTPTELIARADRALLYGKHEDGRGRTVLFSDVPEWFRPGRFTRRGAPAQPRQATSREVSALAAGGWTDATPPAEERLRERARRLSWANSLGARLGALEDVDAILATASRELHHTLGAAIVGVVRRGEDVLGHVTGTGREADVELPAQAIQDARPLLFDSASGPGRLSVPIPRDAPVPWGAIYARSTSPSGFGEDELQLVGAVVDHISAALRSALRFEALRRGEDPRDIELAVGFDASARRA